MITLPQLLEGNSDLYVSQDTWNGYESMLRYLKKYDFKFQKTEGTGMFFWYFFFKKS